MKWNEVSQLWKGMLFHTSAAPWAIENAVHGHELTLVQDCISFNPAWKSALKAMHLTGGISGSRMFRKRRDLLTWMFRKKRELEMRLSDFFFFFNEQWQWREKTIPRDKEGRKSLASPSVVSTLLWPQLALRQNFWGAVMSIASPSHVSTALKTTSLAVQSLGLHASTAGHTGLIPGLETKILHATWCSQ